MIIKRDEFIKKLSLFPRNKKVALPILEGLLIRVHNGTIEIQGTNLEYFFKVRMEVNEAEEKFETVVCPQPLINFLKGCKAECSVEFKDGKLVVRSNGSVLKLNTMLPEEYPDFPPDNDVSFITISPDFLKLLKTASSFTATTAESYNQRYQGVLIRSDNEGKIAVAATDTYRLFHINVDFPEINLVELDKDILIHSELVKLAYNSFFESDSEILLGFNEEKVIFKNDKLTLIGRLLEETFPDYKQVFPKEDPEAVFTCNCSALLPALKKLMAVKANVVLVKVNQDKVVLSSEGMDVGRAETELDVDNARGGGEYKYNLEVLSKSISPYSSEVRFALYQERPAVITGTEGEPIVLVAPVIESV